MLYFDYTWDLSDNGIVLDQELDAYKLGWKEGDSLDLSLTENGSICLKKE